MPGQQTAMRAWHQQQGQDWVQVGRAFMNDKGVDFALHYTPLTQGRVLILLRTNDPPFQVSQVQGQPWKVLHGRRYTAQGQEKTVWTKVGRASMHESGFDLVLDYLPPYVDGLVRMILRMEDNGPQRAANNQQRGQYGGAAAGYAQQQPQYRAPQHRDQLSGRVDPGPQPPAYVDPQDEIPF